MNALPLANLVKNATQKNHTDVEELLMPKLSSIASADDYAAILKMFYGYFYPVERSIQQHLKESHLSDINERRKADAILQDLGALKMHNQEVALCTKLPSLQNTAGAFGALYVLEGSTLGGKMIARMLTKNPVVPETALHFFSGYKEQTGSKWKSFLEVFNQQPQEGEVVAAANDTFYFLKRWMQHTLYGDRN